MPFIVTITDQLPIEEMLSGYPPVSPQVAMENPPVSAMILAVIPEG